MLPDLDGLAILSTMRGVGLDTPVLVMSAMSEVDQRIAGLRAGGDDYLVKPFSLDEMVARLEVLMRRRPRSAHAETVLRAPTASSSTWCGAPRCSARASWTCCPPSSACSNS